MATNQKRILQEQENFREDFKKLLAKHHASLEICIGESMLDEPVLAVTLDGDVVNSFDLLKSELISDT